MAMKSLTCEHKNHSNCEGEFTITTLSFFPSCFSKFTVNSTTKTKECKCSCHIHICPLCHEYKTTSHYGVIEHVKSFHYGLKTPHRVW